MGSSCLLLSHSLNFLTKLRTNHVQKVARKQHKINTVHYCGSAERNFSIQDPMVAFGSLVDLNTLLINQTILNAVIYLDPLIIETVFLER